MGKNLMEYYRENVKQTWKTAFFAAVILGLCVHLFKFANALPNHDSPYNYYDPQNIITSGRWFLTVACGISSYYDLPWLIGMLSILYLALTAVIVTDIFDIENPLVIILVGGIVVSYPSITETLFFEYTADGYFLAMLLAAVASRVTTLDRIDFLRMLVASLCICLSCGIYQAYVSFALVLSVCYLVMVLLENRCSAKDCWIWTGKQAAVYAVGLGAYYLVWQICMKVQGVKAGSYQGIDQIGTVSASLLLNGLMETVEELMLFFFEWNVFRNGWSLYSVLNTVFLLLMAASIGIACFRTGILRRMGHLGLLLLCLAALPLCVCMWCFVSDTVDYRPMMMGSTCILYIFTAVLLERWAKPLITNLAGIVLALVIFNNAVQANICYFYLDECYERTYATAMEMVFRIRPAAEETGATKLAIAGNIRPEVALDANEPTDRIHLLSPVLEETLMFDHIHVTMILDHMYDLGLIMVSDEEAVELSQTDEVAQMGRWPASDSLTVIGDTVVIKLDDYEAGER